MNKKLSISLAPLLVLAALAVMPVMAQAAPPEYGRCIKVKAGTGKYKDAGCEKGVVLKGSYEWLPGPGPKPNFTSTEGKSVFETPGKEKLTCLSDTDKGSYTGAKTDSETIVFTGCEIAGVKCQNGLPGEITTKVLTSEIGYIKKPTTVGVSLAGPGGVFAEFECGGLTVVISGSVIAPVPVSKMQTTIVVKFIASKGHQKPEKFEGAPKDTLTCTVLQEGKELKSEQCGFTSTDTITNEEAIEANEAVEPIEAPKWWVEGKLLAGPEPIAETTTVPVPFKLELHGKKIGNFTIECTEVKVEGGVITPPGSRSEEAIVYGSCIVVGKPECAIGTTKTKPLTANLEGPTGSEKLKFEPQVGSEIAMWKVTQVAGKPPCTVKGLYRTNGEMICNYKAVESEEPEHPLEFTAGSGSKVTATGSGAEGSAGFIVTDRVHLASGKLWSAF